MDDRQKVPILVDIIRQSIKDCIDGSSSAEEARKAFDILKEKYAALERRLISPRSQGYFRGILYHHNLSNYCKVTALMRRSGDSFEPDSSVGDKILLAAVPELIGTILEKCGTGAAVREEVSWSGSKKYFFAARRLPVQGEEMLFTALSSSPLFRIEVFDRFCGLIEGMILGRRRQSALVRSDIPSGKINEMLDIISSPSSSTLTVCIHNYEVLGRILLPMGMAHLNKAFTAITEALREKYPQEGRILALSHYRHAAVFDTRYEPHQDLVRPLMLTFMGTPIPSRVEVFDLGDEQSRSECVRSLFI